MRVETPADACVVLAALMVGADEVGTLEEGAFIFETMAELPMFGDMDSVQFSELVAEAAQWVWTTFPSQDDRMTDEGISDLLELVRTAIGKDDRADVARAAAGIAKADGMNSDERALLRQICRGLDIDSRLTRELLDSSE
jgi:tellurite resistance protein